MKDFSSSNPRNPRISAQSWIFFIIFLKFLDIFSIFLFIEYLESIQKSQNYSRLRNFYSRRGSVYGGKSIAKHYENLPLILEKILILDLQLS